jgi:hypothetical protein
MICPCPDRHKIIDQHFKHLQATLSNDCKVRYRQSLTRENENQAKKNRSNAVDQILCNSSYEISPQQSIY